MLFKNRTSWVELQFTPLLFTPLHFTCVNYNSLLKDFQHGAVGSLSHIGWHTFYDKNCTVTHPEFELGTNSSCTQIKLRWGESGSPAVLLHDSYKYIIPFHQLLKLSHSITEPRPLITQTSSSSEHGNNNDFSTDRQHAKVKSFAIFHESSMLQLT